MLTKLNKHFLITFLMLGTLFVGVVACGPSTTEPATGQTEEEGDSHSDGEDHDEGDSHSDDSHDDGHSHDEASSDDRIPNDGAEIRITSPADGDTFPVDEEVLVEVDVTGFVLGEDGNHWHVFVDGVSYGMVEGGNMDEVLRGLEPGMHEVSVRLANGDHIELMEGDAVMITVAE